MLHQNTGEKRGLTSKIKLNNTCQKTTTTKQAFHKLLTKYHK